MLDAFGAGDDRMVLLDATGGTNKYGYQLYSLVVVDDFREGVPVAFMLTSSQAAKEVKLFMDKVQEKTTRTIRYAMIDKSPTEMRALDDCSIQYFLCFFHVLQAWERFVRSADGGVRDQGMRKAILANIKKLAGIRDRANFVIEETAFKHRWAHHAAVVQYYNDNWACCAEHWAFYGRTAVSAMDVNTNNHLERWNGTLKYVFLMRKKARQLAQLLSLLVTEVMPHYIHDRQKKLAGLESSAAMSALQRHQHQVQFILERGYVTPTGDKAMGGFTCTSVKHPGSTSYSGHVGELFCSCPQACRNVCKHLEAAATSIGFTHAMRLRTAEALVDHLEEVDLSSGVLQCRRLCPAAPTAASCTLNIYTWFCTCLDSQLFHTCAHLLAAQLHDTFKTGCNLATYDPPAPADINERIEVRRLPPLAMPLDVEEPLNRFGGEAAVKALMEATQTAKSTSSAIGEAGALPEGVKEVRRCAAVFRQFANNAQLVAPAQLDKVMPAMRELADLCEASMPHFAVESVPSKMTWNRQETDRTCKPLFSHRKRSAPDAADALVCNKPLVRMPECGRQPTKERSLGNFQRQSKACYPKRKTRQKSGPANPPPV
eukprot:TRINITY_DN630_c0_g1_i7.p1 TRINITY_DN630_c0_g1~~TRINITY_DN630_c0_g1_i7.p1  ORF type:complete len:600 (-),score=121.78 TRINITY_DN630_c0_g1_i7:81-1880(-)